MNADIFVKNVYKFCKRKGTNPTNATRNCGIGTSFLSDIKRGRVPSVDKFEKLAAYLGVTTSELLGETPPVSKLDTNQFLDARTQKFVRLFESLSEDKQNFVIAAMRGMIEK